MPYWLWSVIALVLFFPLLVRVLMLLTLNGMRFQAGDIRPANEAEVPDWERELLRGADAPLSRQGFRFAGWARQRDELAGPHDIRFLACYAHPEHAVWAYACQYDNPLPQCPYLISYLSFFTHGKVLLTRNLDESIEPGILPYLVEQYPMTGSWDDALKTHLTRHAELASEAPAERVPMEALCFMGAKIGRDQLEAYRRQGKLGPAEAGLERLSFNGLWALARRVGRLKVPLARARSAWALLPQTFPLPPRAEAQSFLRISRHGPKAGGWSKALLIIASLAVFSLLQGEGLSWAWGISLILVLFVHEMGHALAMRWVGYRNVNVFFIPFFGAIATGRPTGTLTPWKEAFILFAGPVPGMLAGAWLVTSGHDGDLGPFSQLGFLALFVNAFNLLPISPLDGGRLMELVFFRRSPLLKKIFTLASALALGAIAFTLSEPILGALSLFILWSELKSGKTKADLEKIRRIRREHGEGNGGTGAPDPGLVTSLFEHYKADPPLPFIEKMTRIKVLLAEPVAEPRSAAAGAASSAGILVVFACAWIVPATSLIAPFLSAFKPPETLTREGLSPGESELFDGLCGDTSVYQLSMYRLEDSLYMMVGAIAPGDTARVARIVEGFGAPIADIAADSEDGQTGISGVSILQARMLTGNKPVHVTIRTPIWALGGLDSTMLQGWKRRMEETGKGREAGKPSKEDQAAQYQRTVTFMDSLRRAENLIWEAWSPERRNAWLEVWRKKNAGTPLLSSCPEA
jgi:Zn-dependent protease